MNEQNNNIDSLHVFDLLKQARSVLYNISKTEKCNLGLNIKYPGANTLTLKICSIFATGEPSMLTFNNIQNINSLKATYPNSQADILWLCENFSWEKPIPERHGFSGIDNTAVWELISPKNQMIPNKTKTDYKTFEDLLQDILVRAQRTNNEQYSQFGANKKIASDAFLISAENYLLSKALPTHGESKDLNASKDNIKSGSKNFKI